MRTIISEFLSHVEFVGVERTRGGDDMGVVRMREPGGRSRYYAGMLHPGMEIT